MVVVTMRWRKRKKRRRNDKMWLYNIKQELQWKNKV